ncbi:MAG: class I SAM-dependent methyltransferase [Myxococcales bacterium]|nr:class I SAM-dependent methyltransferase [Myxococcales bacterium]
MNEAASKLVCAVCGQLAQGAPERARVVSNVRRLGAEEFEVWRCSACRSIHAAGAVSDAELAAYYQDYPFARGKRSRVTRYLHGRLWRRVARVGISGHAKVLDYGCGAGLLVADLCERGLDAAGYDAYTPAFQRPALLQQRYDVVLAQDVLEHVEDPLALLERLGALCRPGGVLAIGTPDASAIDLARPSRWKHSLHQPFHRHLLASPALLAAGAARGWQLLRYYPRSYANTPVPTLNLPYLLRYLRAVDDTIDVAFDPPAVRLAMFSPAALWDALFGALRCPASDGLAVFRVPEAALPKPPAPPPVSAGG